MFRQASAKISKKQRRDSKKSCEIYQNLTAKEKNKKMRIWL